MKELMTHYERYPLMQIEDFIKLIYQRSFGPRHFSQSISEEKIMSMLKDELQLLEPMKESIWHEDIGGGYCRIHLDAVLLGKISIEELSQAFVKSMSDASIPNPKAKNILLSSIDVLLELITKGMISLPIALATEFVQRYLDSDIMAIHHSEIFKEKYHPHYRVIKTKYIKELLL